MSGTAQVYRCNNKQCDIPLTLTSQRECPFCQGTFEPVGKPRHLTLVVSDDK